MWVFRDQSELKNSLSKYHRRIITSYGVLSLIIMWCCCLSLLQKIMTIWSGRRWFIFLFSQNNKFLFEFESLTADKSFTIRQLFTHQKWIFRCNIVPELTSRRTVPKAWTTACKLIIICLVSPLFSSPRGSCSGI